MATRFFALALLLALVQLSRAVHFTNTNWTIVQDQPFLLQWEYADGEPPNSTLVWYVVIWTTPNQAPLQPANNIFHSTY